MADTKTGHTARTADYFCYDLSDGVQEERKFVPLPDGLIKFSTWAVHDLPSELSPIMKSSLRLKLRDDMWDDQGRIYLVRTRNAKQKELRGCGVQFDDCGPYIERQGRSSVEFLMHYLPSMANRPLIGHLVPATSWGANLHRLLTDECWQILRKQTFDACHNRCEICGGTGDLECHELWEYHEPVDGNHVDAIGVQELKRLMSLCPHCHQAHHLGFAKLQGQLDRAFGHVAYINRWDTQQVSLYYDYIMSAWKRRSSYPWMLDLSCLTIDNGITLRQQWRMTGNRFITARTEYGEALTKLLGIQWRLREGGSDFVTQVQVTKIRNVPVQGRYAGLVSSPV